MIFKGWSLIQDRYDAEETKKVESLFCLGNGYLCVRASDEEPQEASWPMTLVAGLFDRAEGAYATELANCVNVVRADIIVNGQPLDLAAGKTENYKKELNLYTGLLTRSFEWTAPDGARIRFDSKRFVSLADKHLVVSKVEITALTDNVNLVVKTGIFSTNRIGAKHFESVDTVEDKYLYAHERTLQTGLDLVVVSRCLADKGHAVTMKADGDIYHEYQVKLKKDESFKFQKRSRYCTVRDKDYSDRTVDFIRDDCAKTLDAVEMVRFTDLHKQSADLWAEHWAERAPIIDTDNQHDIVALRFAIYHLVIMTPAHDDRMNIGAKGMTGPGYAGHTFWDTEIYILPYFIFENPDVARSLVTYRYRSLEGAHKKAAENGYVGAMFPWESAWLNDGEVTPGWARTGLLEHHITADVAQGVQYYYLTSGDEAFMEKYGYELIFDTALYWQNRVQWNEEKGRYEILCVIGPDEYREDVDNNAYTNYMAWYNMQLALTYYRKLKGTVLLSSLSNKLNLEGMEERWAEVCEKLYLPKPNEDGIVPQDDTILSLEHVDLAEFKTGKKDFFQTYSEGDRLKMQHSKQADVMVLFLLLEDLFTREVKKKNVYYYEAVCLHGSSLSLSSYAMLAADIGEKELAYDLFSKACRIDLADNPHGSQDGIHAASLGGIWQDTVLGFMGVRLYGDKLRIQPNMPDAWRSAQSYINWQGQKLLLKTTADSLHIERVTGDKPTTFLCNGKEYTFEDKFDLKLGEQDMIKALILDLDGVITDTARFHFLAWKKLADELGMHFTEKDNERLKGVDRMTSLEILLEVNGACDKFTCEEKADLAAKKNEYYKAYIKTMTPADVLPGIPQLIDDAKKAGIRLAVASASKNAPVVLDRIGLIDRFDYIADAARVTKQKPDPEIFTVCAEALGVKPCECLGIEDAQAGIQAIHGAGMTSVGIHVDVTCLEPDIVLQSTSELNLCELLKREPV